MSVIDEMSDVRNTIMIMNGCQPQAVVLHAQ